MFTKTGIDHKQPQTTTNDYKPPPNYHKLPANNLKPPVNNLK